jgi:hypothetical protein
MTEMEVAEMIERHIDFYTVDNDGSDRGAHTVLIKFSETSLRLTRPP